MSHLNSCRAPAHPDFVKQVAEEKTQRLAAQWPKKHKHANGGADTTIMPSDWNKLQFAYKQTDVYCTMESRHCHCGSTLAVMTEIHDLSEE